MARTRLAGAGLILYILLAQNAPGQTSVGPFTAPDDALLAAQRIGTGEVRVSNEVTAFPGCDRAGDRL